MSKLIRWDTPFADAFYPSVTAGFSGPFTGHDELKIAVAPQGIDKYPKYLISFEKILTFSCFDEACAPERDWPEVEFDGKKPCSWQWLSSPSIRSYEGCGNFDPEGNSEPLYHYLLFGGDYNVEVVTRNTPTIEEIRTETIIKLDFDM